jgi:hypothetical protein
MRARPALAALLLAVACAQGAPGVQANQGGPAGRDAGAKQGTQADQSAQAVQGAPAAQSAEDPGRALYERGAGLSARAGADGAWVLRGAAVACANCHGLQATGGGEGGLRAPDLRWPAWSSPDADVRAQARARLARALREGRAADGRLLATAMPRFDLDEAALHALAGHIATLASQGAPRVLPRLALLRMAGASVIERDVQQRLRACLAERLQGRARLEEFDADGPGAAARQWAQWQREPDLLAALAPAWRGWQPKAGDAPPLPALFPLVGDPSAPAPPGVHWLFGGAEARTVALVEAWLQLRPAAEPLAVWVGPGDAAQSVAAALDRIAATVLQASGQRLDWQRLARPQVPAGRTGLWLDDTAAPPAGWWLQPLADLPGPGSRRWRAHPYPGTPPRPLAQRWAEAACLSADAALGDGAPATRAQWSQALARQGRLRADAGWEWQLPRDDGAGYGAATAWTVLEFSLGQPPRVVLPLVAVDRPAGAR